MVERAGKPKYRQATLLIKLKKKKNKLHKKHKQHFAFIFIYN